MAAPAENSQDRQKRHYETLLADYESHYFDAWSWQYRQRFIHPHLLGHETWQGKKVLEAMCGPGSVAGPLRDRGAEVVGLDLSRQAAAAFAARWKLPSVVGSIAQAGFKPRSFDAIVIVGGLHHLHPHLDQSLRAMADLLKPGGSLSFFEPHSGSWLDKARKIWYRHDALFERNEASIDPRALVKKHGDLFASADLVFGGNIAYMLIFNSMIWRLSPKLKPILAKGLLGLETWIQKAQGEKLACFVIGRWRKR